MTDINSLLSIKVGGNTYISDASGNMKQVSSNGSLTSVNLITLSNIADTFNSVVTIVPPNTVSHALNNLSVIPLNARKDSDGDNTFTVTGNVIGEWTDKNGNSIGSTLTDIPTMCNAPYTLTLTASGSPSIATQYGVPRLSIYGNGSAKFTINPAGVSTICFAKPEMTYATGISAGPASMWNTAKGFIPQSTDAATYYKNFPTTGVNNVYFDLDIGGVKGALAWPTVKVGSVTATMTNITNTTVRVTLTGPKANSTNIGATAAAFSPVQVVLEGKLGATTVVKYGFKLQKWYVNRGAIKAPSATQASWCAGLNGSNYVLPKVADLTSASGLTSANAIIPTVPYPNYQYNTNYNSYWRHIGGGLFSEWGYMSNFPAADFTAAGYWTREKDSNGTQFHASSYIGSVYNTYVTLPVNGICTQP